MRPLQHAGVLTNTAPWDHRWHHGLWWSWKFLDDVLYWEDHAGYGRQPGRWARSCGLDRSVVSVDEAGSWSREELDWRASQAGRMRRCGSSGRWRTRRPSTASELGHRLGPQWTARGYRRLSVTPYPEHWWGGYAGLNFRAARSMAAGELILASGEPSGREAVHRSSRHMGGPPRKRWTARDRTSPSDAGVRRHRHPRASRTSPGAGVPRTRSRRLTSSAFCATAPLMHQGDHLDADAAAAPPLQDHRARRRRRARELLDRLARQYGERRSRSSTCHSGRRRKVRQCRHHPERGSRSRLPPFRFHPRRLLRAAAGCPSRTERG